MKTAGKKDNRGNLIINKEYWWKGGGREGEEWVQIKLRHRDERRKEEKRWGERRERKSFISSLVA